MITYLPKEWKLIVHIKDQEIPSRVKAFGTPHGVFEILCSKGLGGWSFSPRKDYELNSLVSATSWRQQFSVCMWIENLGSHKRLITHKTIKVRACFEGCSLQSSRQRVTSCASAEKEDKRFSSSERSDTRPYSAAS